MKPIIFSAGARNQEFPAQRQIIQTAEWDAVITALLLLQLMQKCKN